MRWRGLESAYVRWRRKNALSNRTRPTLLLPLGMIVTKASRKLIPRCVNDVTPVPHTVVSDSSRQDMV